MASLDLRLVINVVCCALSSYLVTKLCRSSFQRQLASQKGNDLVLFECEALLHRLFSFPTLSVGFPLHKTERRLAVTIPPVTTASLKRASYACSNFSSLLKLPTLLECCSANVFRGKKVLYLVIAPLRSQIKIEHQVTQALSVANL